MTGVITTGSFPKALWPGIQAWYGLNYDDHGQECRDLFEFRGSDKAYEEVVEAIGFGLAPEKEQGTSVQYADSRQGAVNRFTNRAYALGYIVTYEEQVDNLYRQLVEERAQRLAFSMKTTKEIVAANVYNRAFAGAFVFGDGQPLISTAHPSDVGSQSNRLAVDADLSEQALEDLSIQIDNAKDPAGLQVALRARSLHIPTQLKFTAERILGSVLQNNTANNAINALKSMDIIPEGAKMNHYFDSTTAWFIRTDAPTSMIAYQREDMGFSEDNDFDTANMKFKAYERWVPGVGDWRGLYGSPGV